MGIFSIYLAYLCALVIVTCQASIMPTQAWKFLIVYGLAHC